MVGKNLIISGPILQAIQVMLDVKEINLAHISQIAHHRHHSLNQKHLHIQMLMNSPLLLKTLALQATTDSIAAKGILLARKGLRKL